MQQEQEQKRTPRRGEGAPPAEEGGQSTAVQRGERLKEEIDELLDEIDEVLEENAEEFVKSYVQRGGE